MQRLDTALVERGLARSRSHAARLIADRCVTVAGRLAQKPAAPVAEGAAVLVDPGDDWASRGAHKLLGALDRFAIDVTGRRAVDAGASTGGFTDVLLRRGAAAVAAIDVGAGQLAPTLAVDPRVRIYDGVNIRELTSAAAQAIRADLGGPVDLVVADLSFISLTLVLPALTQLADPAADLLPMVKPQFEVGKGRLGAGGVVRRAELRAEAVAQVVAAAAELGWGAVDIAASPLPGPSGNIEYFLHLRAGIASADAGELIAAAVAGDPR